MRPFRILTSMQRGGRAAPRARVAGPLPPVPDRGVDELEAQRGRVEPRRTLQDALGGVVQSHRVTMPMNRWKSATYGSESSTLRPLK